MKKRVFIIHGWDGNPQKEWLPWVKSELEKRDFLVSTPSMPNSAVPKIDAWTNYLKEQVGNPDRNTYFVGHSIGCQAILRYISKLKEGEKVGGVVFVAGFVNLRNLPGKEEEEIAKPWLTKPIQWENIKKHTKKFTAIFSDDDTWVPLSDSEVFKKKLGAKIIVQKKMGHFTEDDNIFKLPVVLSELIKIAE